MGNIFNGVCMVQNGSENEIEEVPRFHINEEELRKMSSFMENQCTDLMDTFMKSSSPKERSINYENLDVAGSILSILNHLIQGYTVSKSKKRGE